MQALPRSHSGPPLAYSADQIDTTSRVERLLARFRRPLGLFLSPDRGHGQTIREGCNRDELSIRVHNEVSADDMILNALEILLSAFSQQDVPLWRSSVYSPTVHTLVGTTAAF